MSFFKKVGCFMLGLGALALPAAAQDGTGYPTTVPASVDTALSAAEDMGVQLAQKVGPVVMTIGVAFLGVAVVWFAIRLIGGFLAKRRGV